MQHADEIINYLQANEILAKKLDRAFNGVSDVVSHQIENIGSGVQRALYYTSCFTEAYQEVCQKQKTEDVRFAKGAIQLIRHGSVINDMLKIYFNEILRYEKNNQLEQIKKSLMAVNVHIAASHLTQHGFVLAVTAAVAVGLNAGFNIRPLAGRTAGGATVVAGIYGVVQKAADSTNRLNYALPAYYAALHESELEMMYFLIAPLLEKSGALRTSFPSDDNITKVISNRIM